MRVWKVRSRFENLLRGPMKTVQRVPKGSKGFEGMTKNKIAFFDNDVRGQARRKNRYAFHRFFSEHSLGLTECPYCYNLLPCKGEDVVSDDLAAALRRAINLTTIVNLIRIVYDESMQCHGTRESYNSQSSIRLS